MSIRALIPLIGESSSTTPLSNVAITYVSGTAKENETVTLSVSWVGGVGPYTVSVYTDYYGSNSVQASASGITGKSTNVSVTAKMGVAWYYVIVHDTGANTFSRSNDVNYPTIWIRANSPSYTFNTTTKTATFYGTANGNPAPTYEWYVSVNGAPWQFWTTASSWTSGAFSPSTTMSVYYMAKNTMGTYGSSTIYNIGYQ